MYSFYQGSRQILQLLKWSCHTSFFTHVEPYFYYTSYPGCSELIECVDDDAKKDIQANDSNYDEEHDMEEGQEAKLAEGHLGLVWTQCLQW